MAPEHVLLFTDAVDSTQLTERLGDAAASSLWATHDRIVRRLMREHGGREIDKSDGFLLLFEDVSAAAACAIALHREFAQLDPPVSSRAGIHRGPMVTRENSPDDQALGAKALEIDGIGKAVASRIMSLARGGQTLLSAEAHASLRLAHDWQAASHGHWRLKGLVEPIELFEVGLIGAPVLPPPDSPKSYRVVRVDDRWTPRAELRHGLPAERDGFVGRHDALAALAAQMDGGTRLVTVLGIGGIGKTRLALRYARDWLGDYPGGAWFCDLSSARTLDGLVHAAAQGLDVPLGKADPVHQLGAAIAGRGRCLVILDNFEQVARLAEATLGQWLQNAAEARFLVTSREVLGIPGEEVFALAPLDDEDALRLFESRARAAVPDYAPRDAERAALLRLVELLDRLPLAIELAAARVRLLSAAAMVERMGERFKLLASTSGGRRERQATLRGALDWSWDLLLPLEQSVLAQLSVFEGGFTLAAAEAVVDLADESGSVWLGDVLQGLMEKSLLGRSSAQRFGFLRTVLDYLLDRCRHAPTGPGAAGPLALAAAHRHLRYYAGLDDAAATAERCAETGNLMLACRRALPDESALAVAALVNLWAALRMTGPLRAIAPILDATNAAVRPGSFENARLLGVAAGMLHQTGDLPLAFEKASEGLRLAMGNEAVQLRLEITAADVLRSLGRLGEAAEHAFRALALAERHADTLATLEALNSLGALHQIKGEFPLALRAYHRALELAKTTDHPRWQGGLLGNLAVIARLEGRPGEARRCFDEALALAATVGDRQWEGNNRSNLALLLHGMGQHRAAEEQLLQALQIARDIGHDKIERFVLCNLGIVYEALHDDAAALASFEQSVALCVASGDRHSEFSFRGYLGLHLARSGQHQRAASEFECALTPMRQLDSPSALQLLLAQAALAAALAGDADKSGVLACEVKALLATNQVRSSTECSALLDEARGPASV